MEIGWAKLLCLPILLCLAGCQFCPVYLAERPLLAKRLPDGVKMTDYVQPGFNVAEKLAWLGAWPGRDGKIYDFTGKEIRFWPDNEPRGAQPVNYDAIMKARRETLAEWQRHYRVIEMMRDPSLPPVP